MKTINMKTIKLSKILLSTFLLLGLSSITLNAQNADDTKNKVKTTKNDSKKPDDSKQITELKNYQKWNSDYTKNSYQRGSISSH